MKETQLLGAFCLVVNLLHAQTDSNTPLQGQTGKYSLHNIQINFMGGYSHRPAPIKPGLSASTKNYVRNLKDGYTYSFDFKWFYSENFGIGLRADQFNTSSHAAHRELDGLYFDEFSQRLRITYVAPTYYSRMFTINKRHQFFGGIGLGLFWYLDNGLINGVSITGKGTSLGSNYSFLYSFFLNERLSLGAQVSYLAGRLTRIKYTNGYSTNTVSLDYNEAESLHQLSLSVGLQLNL